MLFLALMALIAEASWSIYMGLAGLVLLVMGAAFGYLAYSSLQEDKMGDARYHNMERQVLALAKKNKGASLLRTSSTSAFESDEAEKRAGQDGEERDLRHKPGRHGAVGHNDLFVPHAHTVRRGRNKDKAKV